MKSRKPSKKRKQQVGEHFTVKQLEKLRKSLKQKLEKLQGRRP